MYLCIGCQGLPYLCVCGKLYDSLVQIGDFQRSAYLMALAVGQIYGHLRGGSHQLLLGQHPEQLLKIQGFGVIINAPALAFLRHNHTLVQTVKFCHAVVDRRRVYYNTVFQRA